MSSAPSSQRVQGVFLEADPTHEILLGEAGINRANGTFSPGSGAAQAEGDDFAENGALGIPATGNPPDL
jgi:hypothetical protein